MRITIACGAFAALATAAPAAAVDVSLTGLVINTCVLTVPTPGLMALSSDGTRLGSEEGLGGAPATLSVVAAGAAPTLSFAVPSLSGPGGTDGAVTEIAYTALSGENQPYTASASSADAARIDTFTIDGRVSSEDGFTAGTYAVTVTVTCQQ
jgi:hypothetical protein